MIFLYKLLFPAAFLFFIPGLLIKLIRRPGKKSNYAERFGIFSEERKKALAGMKGAIWLHAVSVGETSVALSFLKEWQKEDPERKFIFTTTTTTSQEIAFQKAGKNVEVFFAPIDFGPFVKKFLRLAAPSALIVFETELWPNMILETKKTGAKVFLANGRLSDHSIKGYMRFRNFFAPILEGFDFISAQTALDWERFQKVAPNAKGAVSGNIKFAQKVPDSLEGIDLAPYFGEDFFPILAASTHDPEEKELLSAYMEAKKKMPSLRMILVPRHAERGNDLEKLLREMKLSYHRRSTGEPPRNCDVMLADTTGELLRFYKSSSLVLMGKTFSGNHEGQNVLEPVLMGKAVITGPAMVNFRQAFQILKDANGLVSLEDESLLAETILSLASSKEKCRELGENGQKALLPHAGAIVESVKMIRERL